MTEPLLLELFPTRGFDQSIITPVLLGVYLLWLLCEVFGWGFVGLVVPGYFASVFAISPGSGLAMSIEAVLTLALARGVSRGLSRTGAWSPFFGRERFFLIVLCSVLVRQNTQVWIFPELMNLWEVQFGIPLDVDLQFGSIGLVLVPLIANMFWKLPLRDGVFQVAVPTGLVWLALTAFLLPHTNLSLSSMELTYEGFALDFLGSPKAYIVLLTTAYLAAQFNLWYGWDYNGILVPALLSLVWLEPAEVATTIGIALVLVVLVNVALRLPGLRSTNMEGPRKLVLTFTVAYVLEYAIAVAIGDRFAHVKVTDLFGFGYLLPSLIAVKMIQKQKVVRIAVPIVLVSGFGFVAGSVVGLLFEVVLPRPTELTPEPPLGVRSDRSIRSPEGVLDLARARVRPLADSAVGEALPRERHPRLGGLARWVDAGGPTPPGLIADAASHGWSLARVSAASDGRSFHALVEREERLTHQAGLPTILLEPGARGPGIALDATTLDRLGAEWTMGLCAGLRCSAIVVGERAAVDHERDAVLEIVGRARPVMEVEIVDGAETSVLHVHGKVGDAFDFRNAPIASPQVTWAPPADRRGGWGKGGSHAVLRLAESAFESQARDANARFGTPVEGSLEAWLRQRAEADAPASFVPHSETELRVLERMAADVITTALMDGPANQAWSGIAERLGARLYAIDDAWVIDAPELGVMAVRRDASRPLAVTVPRPHQELEVAEIAVSAWSVARGRVLVFGPPTNVRPRADYDPDPTRPGNVATAMQAWHQAVHRALRDKDDALIVQLRGLADERPVASAALVAVDRPVLVPERQVPRTLEELSAGPWAAMLSGAGLVDGGASTVDLDGQRSPQMKFSRTLPGPRTAMVWLTEARRRELTASGAKTERRRDERMGIETVSATADALLQDPPLGPLVSNPTPDPRFDELAELAATYVATRSMVTRQALSDANDDPATRVAFGALEPNPFPFVFIERTHAGVVRRRLVLISARAECTERRFDPAPGAGEGGRRSTAEAIATAVFEHCRALEVFGAAPSPLPTEETTP